MPGRLRLHLPAVCRKKPVAEAFVAWLRAQPGIMMVRINYECASFVVEYDVANHKFLQGMLQELRHTSLGDVRFIIARRPVAPRPWARASRKGRCVGTLRPPPPRE
jgi:hypothetical protein